MKLLLSRYNYAVHAGVWPTRPPGRSYRREELLRLRSADITLPQPACKAIFSRGLWLLRHQKNPWQHGERKWQLITTTVQATTSLSMLPGAPSSTSIKSGSLNVQSVIIVNKRCAAPCTKPPLCCGWLNARSLPNKTIVVDLRVQGSLCQCCWRSSVCAFAFQPMVSRSYDLLSTDPALLARPVCFTMSCELCWSCSFCSVAP